MKYRKKPIVIDAEQFFPDKKPWPKGVENGPCYCGGLAQDGEQCEIHKPRGARYYIIRTLEGQIRVTLGDWIITGIKGERYPCKPDIFEATYEEVKHE